jgi:phosphomannomutase/phosphoglucomutase
VVVDAGNGVGGIVSVPMLEKLGYDVVPLYCEPDGRFPNHHADPTVAKNLELLIAAVKKREGRPGRRLRRRRRPHRRRRRARRDHLGRQADDCALSRGAQSRARRRHRGRSEVQLHHVRRHREARRQPIMWKTGHSLIKAKMKELPTPMLAGEMSGHIFYKHRFFGFDDAPYTAARLLEISRTRLAPCRPAGRRAGDLLDARAALRHGRRKEVRLVKRCTELLRAKGLAHRGRRRARTWPDGWGLIRASNTTPLLVVRYEAKTKARLHEIQTLVDGVIATARQEVGG